MWIFYEKGFINANHIKFRFDLSNRSYTILVNDVDIHITTDRELHFALVKDIEFAIRENTPLIEINKLAEKYRLNNREFD
jgi:hypothetical protein